MTESAPNPDDLRQMRSALAFAVKLLRDEMGPGGLVEREPDSVRATWILAMQCLEAAGTVPMIPLYSWRRRDVEVPAVPAPTIQTLTRVDGGDPA
jgi:hypothetical protein